jgi:tRNA G18 (ribose-2'-O)-methylase SpoU
MTFNTVLNQLRSAKNIGMIARSHLAFGGELLIIIGDKNKWNFKGGTSTYTRKIDELEKLIFFETFQLFLDWNKKNFKGLNLAIEIDDHSAFSTNYKMPDGCNIILGNERTGIRKEELKLCDKTITIPQVNAIGSLNVAISASIIFYEFSKSIENNTEIKDFKYVQSV